PQLLSSSFFIIRPLPSSTRFPYTTLFRSFGVLVIMSVGSFYILITKLLEQRKIFSQYRNVRSQFWRAGTLREGVAKLDKNSAWRDRKSTRLNSSHVKISYAVFCLKKKKLT